MSGGRVLATFPKIPLNLRCNSFCPESFGTGPDQATLINLLSSDSTVSFMDWVSSCLALKSVYGQLAMPGVTWSLSVPPGFYWIIPSLFCDVEFLLPDGLEDEGGQSPLGLGDCPLWDGELRRSEYTPPHSFSGCGRRHLAFPLAGTVGEADGVVLPVNTSAVGWSGSTADELGGHIPVGCGIVATVVVFGPGTAPIG